MKLKNAGHFNEDVLKYINDVIEKVNNIRAENVENLGTMSQLMTDGWSKTKLAGVANINGINIGMLRLLKNYLLNQKQDSVIVRDVFTLKTTKNISNYFSSGTFVQQTADNLNVITMEIPKGFSGNNSFVQIGIPYGDDDYPLFPTTPVKDYIATSAKINTSLYSPSDDVPNALTRLAPLLGTGKLGFTVAKTERFVTIKYESSNIDWDTLLGDVVPRIAVKITCFKRGIK